MTDEYEAFKIAREGMEQRLKPLVDAALAISDQQLHEIGYADGSYLNHCFKCSKTFDGAKRSIICKPCAISVINERFRGRK